MLRLQGGEAPALFLDISLFLFLILYQGVYKLYQDVSKMHPPASKHFVGRGLAPAIGEAAMGNGGGGKPPPYSGISNKEQFILPENDTELYPIV